MKRDGNLYTFLFATVMVIVVAGALSITATGLKSKQLNNIRKEKMQNILKTVGIEVTRESAEAAFEKYIKDGIVITKNGKEDDITKAFLIDLAKELKKDVSEQQFPLFMADIEGKIYYVVPLRGSGLWDAIWGYISLESDFNTIRGVIFDHKGETAGLGAEITQNWFQERFKGETIFDGNGNLAGITVLKGNEDPNGEDKQDHEVDAISGATITGNGVTKMITERLSHYIEYAKEIREKK